MSSRRWNSRAGASARGGEPRHDVKLADVARLAGVSTATVSRALSTPNKVSPEMLRRVEEAVRLSGYVLHGAARALRSRRSRTVGAVVPTLDNAIFANATHALQKTLEENGYTLLVASHEFDLEGEVRVVRPLLERGIDGLVLVGLDHEPALFDLLESFRLPYVLTWALDPEGRHPCVGFRNRDAAARVAAYLLDMGHRRFGMIAGLTARNDRARERVIGVRETLASRGIVLDPEHVLERPYTFGDGRGALAALMRLNPPPTAVICGNDVLAIGAMTEARAQGIAVPRELSITGFDDLEISSLIEPALTTVRVPTRELGQLAAQHLLARLAGQEVERLREVSVELIVRASTAPPP